MPTEAESQYYSRYYGGFERPDAGNVFVRGKQLGEGGMDFPENIGVFINSPGFIGIYSGFRNLKFLADIQGKIGDREIRDAMVKVGLDPDNTTKTDNYSLGMKQKLGLAQAIMENQDILVLDEPFNALDYKTYEDVKAIIRMLKAEGKTIFLTSHRFQDIEQLCDQIYTLEDCRLIPITDAIGRPISGNYKFCPLYSLKKEMILQEHLLFPDYAVHSQSPPLPG